MSLHQSQQQSHRTKVYCKKNAFSHFLSLPLLLSFFITILISPKTHAQVACILPTDGGTYIAGDPITLNWELLAMPVASPTQQISVNAVLVCNADLSVFGNSSMPTLTGPYSWTIPDVGVATTYGGREGRCLQNAFHVEYIAEILRDGIPEVSWEPGLCGTITISPAPNNTLPTYAPQPTSGGFAPIYLHESGGLSSTEGMIIAVVSLHVCFDTITLLLLLLLKVRKYTHMRIHLFLLML